MGECNLTEVCKFFDKNHSQCKGELECPKKPIHKKKKQLTYANEVEMLQAMEVKYRGYGEYIYHSPMGAEGCFEECIVGRICGGRSLKTGNQIADECQELLNTLVRCPECGAVYEKDYLGMPEGLNWECGEYCQRLISGEPCRETAPGSLWTAHWKPIEPVKRFEPFEFEIYGIKIEINTPEKFNKLMAGLCISLKTARNNRWDVLRKLDVAWIAPVGFFDEIEKKAKEMGLIK